MDPEWNSNNSLSNRKSSKLNWESSKNYDKDKHKWIISAVKRCRNLDRSVLKFTRLENKTRRIAVRETAVSQQHRSQIEDTPWNSSDHDSTIIWRGAINRSPIMPRDASLWDSRCNFFRSGKLIQSLRRWVVLFNCEKYELSLALF